MTDEVQCAASHDCRKDEADMKINYLYERLSRDDGEDRVSNSIQNQRRLLEDYAERNDLKPYRHVQDMGGLYRGVNFARL